MIQVIEGKIKQYSLPKTGTLKNGSTVSGYHLLDEDTLRDEVRISNIARSDAWIKADDYNLRQNNLITIE